MALIDLCIVVSFVTFVTPTSANLVTLKPIAAQNGSQLEIDDIDLTKTAGCSFFVFAMHNFQSPWIEVEMSRFAGRYYARPSGLLTIRSINFSDGGLLRLGCPSVDFLQFLMVFDVVECHSNVSAEPGRYVNVGDRIQTTCEFRYSTGLDVLTTHWTAPIQWTSDGPFEDCSSEIATKESNTSSVFVYRACVVQTASAPEVPPISCSLGYRDFRKVFRSDDEERDSSTAIWKSSTRLVRHPVGTVRVEQGKTLIQTGNLELVQTFTCSADGFPLPTYRWLNVDDRQTKVVDGPSLNVTVHQGHRLFAFTTVQRFVCVATNSFNEMESTEVRVSVPTDLPFYVYVIVILVLVIIVVSVVANVVVGCRATTRRRRQKQEAAVGDRAPSSAPSKLAASMGGREAIQRYADIDGRGRVTHTASIGQRCRDQRMPLPNFDLYTPLDSNNCEAGQDCPVSWMTSMTVSPAVDIDITDFGHATYEMIKTTTHDE